MKHNARLTSRSTAAAALATAAAGCAIASLAGCSSSTTAVQTSQGLGATASASSNASTTAEASPSFLPASTFPSPAHSLPLLTEAPSGTASLPWLLVSRNQNSGKVTIEVVRGNCTASAQGYTASGTSTGVILTVVAGIQHTQACTAQRTYTLYTLTLSAADANKALQHGAIHDWQYSG